MKEYRILNLCAGVQSTMLYLLACENHEVMRDIDCAIFADTGEEPVAVYEHLEWLKGLKGPEILVRAKGNLGDDYMNGVSTTKGGKRFSTIPCFTSGGGMGRRQCTYDYKIAVVEQTIRRDIVGLKPRQRFPKKEVHVHQFLGLSFDEAKRVLRVRARFMDIPWATAHFPLFETNTTRAGAIGWLKPRVPHETPRSACVECPFHSNEEWRRIKAVPADWARACEIDEALRDEKSLCNRGMNQEQFLHKSCVPLAEVDFTAPDVTGEFGFIAECEGMCGI